jgi:hypothetical protein
MCVNGCPMKKPNDRCCSREDTQGVGVAKTTLPTLNSNDGLLWLNDAHGKSVLETVSGRGSEHDN